MNILDFAMEMDRSGRDLYRRLARQAANPGARRVLSWMAREEEHLMDEFRRLKGESPARQAEVPALSMAENPYRHPAGALVPQTDLDAYRMILEMEGKACRLLEKAAEQVTDDAARDFVRRVAALECEEMREVAEVYDFVRAPNEYLAWAEFSNLDEFHNFGRYEDNRACSHTH